MKTIPITSFSDYVENVCSHLCDRKVFRGVSDLKNHQLVPVIGRLQKYANFSPAKLATEERYQLKKFRMEGARYVEGTLDTWEWLVIDRHHGLPTRLLDWTRNPLVALCPSDTVLRSLARQQGILSLGGMSDLSDGQAAILATHCGDLYLDGLKTLPDSVAEHLGHHQGLLSLSSIANLSDTAASSLAKCRGGLVLCGLKAISDRTAEIFSRHEWDLHLDGIQFLGDNAAKWLSKHESLISLKGLTEASDAEKFSKRRPDLNCLSERMTKLIGQIRESRHNESPKRGTHRVEHSHEGGFSAGNP